jgi:hypothetical protein
VRQPPVLSLMRQPTACQPPVVLLPTTCAALAAAVSGRCRTRVAGMSSMMAYTSPDEVEEECRRGGLD